MRIPVLVLSLLSLLLPAELAASWRLAVGEGGCGDACCCDVPEVTSCCTAEVVGPRLTQDCPCGAHESGHSYGVVKWRLVAPGTVSFVPMDLDDDPLAAPRDLDGLPCPSPEPPPPRGEPHSL